jgi:hypothetical protein
MKKLIRICTIMSLLVVFSAVAASAQSIDRIDAKVPFDFNIGNKSYKAGNYVLRISYVSGGVSTIVSLEDENKRHLQDFLVFRSGNSVKNNPVMLFNRYENQMFLSQIQTTEAGFSLKESRTEKQIAGKSRDKKSKTQVSLAFFKQVKI